MLKGVAKVIDELCLMIVNKDVELEEKEFDKLKIKIETIECYIDAYDNHTQ